MKKLIGLSLAICLMVTMVSGFGAFAAFTPTDLDFDGMTLNVTATSETAAADLLAATGWTLNTISGDASVSVVTATDENAAWTGRGDILKLSGGANGGAIKISVPCNYSYANDKLIIEYDVFVPESGLSGQVAMFSTGAYNPFYTFTHSNGVKYLAYDEYDIRKLNADGTYAEGNGRVMWYGFVGKWQKLSYVLTPEDSINGTFELDDVANGGKISVSNLCSGILNITDLTTGTTSQSFKRAFNESRYNVPLTLGGTPKTGNALADTYYLDNVKIYTTEKFVFASSADDTATGYEIDKPYVEFAMNKAVSPASVAGVSVSGVAGATAAVMEDGKTVRVTFNEDLVYGTTYTVDFSGITDVNGQVIESAKKTITFSTKAAPDLYITGKTLYKGVGAYAAPVASIAADDIYTIEATIKNTAASSSQATVICAIYDATGRLVDTVYVGKTVADEEKIGTGLTVPAAAAGGEVKVFLWKDMTSMQAYVKALSFDVAQ